jgi:hypothetical protein
MAQVSPKAALNRETPWWMGGKYGNDGRDCACDSDASGEEEGSREGTGMCMVRPVRYKARHSAELSLKAE